MSRSRVVLVSLAEDEDVLPRFSAAFAAALTAAGGDPADYAVTFAQQPPSGPGVVGIAAVPPVPFTAAHLAALPDLRTVAVASAGYDHVDVAAVAAAGLPVTHTPAYCEIEVADHAIAMIVTLLRNLRGGDQHARSGGWSSRAVGAKRITGSVLGVVGLGRTGRLVAGRALGLGMKVLAWAPRTAPEITRALGVTPVGSLPELLAASDVVTLHLPLTEQTKNIIDADALATMRGGAYLVNCGRGGLIDDYALYDALACGHLGGAALDVLDEEPPPADHIAFTLPNTIITPHLAWFSPQSEYAAYEQAARAIAAVLTGNAPADVVQARR